MKDLFGHALSGLVILTVAQVFFGIADVSDGVVLTAGLVLLTGMVFGSTDQSGNEEVSKLLPLVALGWGFTSGHVLNSLFSVGSVLLSVLLFALLSLLVGVFAKEKNINQTSLLVEVLLIGASGIAIFLEQWWKVLCVLVLLLILRKEAQKTEGVSKKDSAPSQPRLRIAR